MDRPQVLKPELTGPSAAPLKANDGTIAHLLILYRLTFFFSSVGFLIFTTFDVSLMKFWHYGLGPICLSSATHS